jgi:hypothetical protein
MPYIDLTVEVDLNEFDDQELIDELESRDWIVSEEKGMQILSFTDEELDFINEMTKDSKATSVGYEIYLKTRKCTR